MKEGGLMEGRRRGREGRRVEDENSRDDERTRSSLAIKQGPPAHRSQHPSRYPAPAKQAQQRHASSQEPVFPFVGAIRRLGALGTLSIGFGLTGQQHCPFVVGNLALLSSSSSSSQSIVAKFAANVRLLELTSGPCMVVARPAGQPPLWVVALGVLRLPCRAKRIKSGQHSPLP